MTTELNKMGQTERAFTVMAIAIHIGFFINVGRELQKWTEPEFVLAYLVCVLTAVQFIIRYFILIYSYRTERSISSWVTSFLIAVVSAVQIQATLVLPIWFIAHGVLLLLAAVKTHQAIVMVKSWHGSTEDLSAIESNIEQQVRMEEFLILEAAFGVFMIFFSILIQAEVVVLPRLSQKDTIFFGALFAFCFSLFCTAIRMVRVLGQKEIIEEHMRNLD